MAKKKVAKKKVAKKKAAPQMAFPTPQEDRQKPEDKVDAPMVRKRVRVVLLSGNTIIKDILDVRKYVERCLTVGVRQDKGNGCDVIPASGIERIEVRDL